MIRTANLSDCSRMAALESASFGPSEAYSEDFFKALVSTDGCVALVYMLPVGMCGFVVAVIEGDEAHVIDIVVDRSARKKGIGRSLLAALEISVDRIVRSMYAEARAGNTPSIQCFLSCGYNDDGLMESYYTNPQEDAVRLRKTISG